jgi:hypothetical protein
MALDLNAPGPKNNKIRPQAILKRPLRNLFKRSDSLQQRYSFDPVLAVVPV